jgi:predicted hydrocarbon binding protein
MASPDLTTEQPGMLAGLLKSDESAGEIRTADNKRVVITTGELWTALSEALSQRLATELDDVFYAAGLSWGSHAYQEFHESVSSSQKTLYHTRNMGLSDFKAQFNTYLSRHGWGRFDIYQKYDFIFIDLFSSALPDLVERKDAMSCSLMAGFFAGFFTELIGVEFSCIELRCSALQSDKCTFLVADSGVITSVRKWLAKGRSFDEILEDIAGKEYQAKK